MKKDGRATGKSSERRIRRMVGAKEAAERGEAVERNLANNKQGQIDRGIQGKKRSRARARVRFERARLERCCVRTGTMSFARCAGSASSPSTSALDR
eukprot:6202936-Pleurochrysis_carterae.AAC.1